VAPLAGAQAYSEQQDLVDRAVVVANRLIHDPDFAAIRGWLPEAKAVLIVPELLKGGFIFGAEGGHGVLLARGADGTWSYPAFYFVGAASVGLQIGAESKEAMFLIMTDGGLNAVINDQAKIGGDVSGAIGPYGAGLEVSTTTNIDRDIYAFSRGVGLFAGGALEGAVIARRDDYNYDYYGPGATAQTIVLDRAFSNAGAEDLRQLLATAP
jgi:lipid-binding SYLF domain-containing protein